MRISLSVTARLNLRMMSSGLSISRMKPFGFGSDLDIFLVGSDRLMTLPPILPRYGSGIVNVSEYAALKRWAMSRQISMCWSWSTPTGT